MTHKLNLHDVIMLFSSKRNGGMPVECRGRYDTAIYTTLDNICEDCYNLYKEPDVHSMCRWVNVKDNKNKICKLDSEFRFHT